MKVYVISEVNMPHGGTVKETSTTLDAFENIPNVTACYLIAMPHAIKEVEAIVTLAPKIRWLKKRKKNK